jgi:hypothetical protein
VADRFGLRAEEVLDHLADFINPDETPNHPGRGYMSLLDGLPAELAGLLRVIAEEEE